MHLVDQIPFSFSIAINFANNYFSTYRCVCRWQPASHAADPRYIGDIKQIENPKFGVHAKKAKQENGLQDVTIEQKKKEWGFD